MHQRLFQRCTKGWFQRKHKSGSKGSTRGMFIVFKQLLHINACSNNLFYLQIRLKRVAEKGLLLNQLQILLPASPKRANRSSNKPEQSQKQPKTQEETKGPNPKRVAIKKSHIAWVLSNCVDSFSSAYHAHQKVYSS